MVPEAEFTSYYGRPVIKRPVWKSPDVPLYFFLGGLAGSSAVMAAFADATGQSKLGRVGRLAAVTGATAGVGALIHDLGRPERFLNMLRVFRPTSPLSVGSWLLAAFSTLSGAAAASDVTGAARPAGNAAGAGAALLGAPLTTYTAVLVADTAVPAWHEARVELPFLFAGSGAASAGALGMLAAPRREAGPARGMAALGGAGELAAEAVMVRRLGMVGEVYHHGKAGKLTRAARGLTAAGVLGTLGILAAESLGKTHRRAATMSFLGRPSRAASAIWEQRGRVASALTGAALLGGSVCSRFAVFEAGMASAENPKYTVVPQRERVSARSPSEPTS